MWKRCSPLGSRSRRQRGVRQPRSAFTLGHPESGASIVVQPCFAQAWHGSYTFVIPRDLAAAYACLRSVTKDFDVATPPDELEGRAAFFIPSQSGEGGYRPALVVGGRRGVTHIVDGPVIPASWGDTYEEARAVADDENRKRGLSEDDVARLIDAALKHERRWRPPSHGLGLEL